MSTRIKVGFVGFLSCLALMLGMFTSTGVASAHSTQAAHSQTSASTLVNDKGRPRCQTFFIVLNRFNQREEDNSLFGPSNGDVFLGGGNMDRMRHPHVFFRRFERVLVVTICHGHRNQHTVIEPF